VLYIIAELNRPKPIDWTVTLSKDDKNPYGAYILYDRLKDIFPSTTITAQREPIYNTLHNRNIQNAAYVVVAPFFGAAETDVRELLKFVHKGNYVFLSADKISKTLMDTLGLERQDFTELFSKDSTSLNLVNSTLKADTNYGFKKFTIDETFSQLRKKDSTVILGITQNNKPNFVKINVGAGAFFVHSAPLSFSNYFMLFNNNNEYVSKAMSYLPKDIETLYWDEYYKQGRTGPSTPLRFFLSNEWLRWALRISIVGMILYVLVEMKRRQRIIPVIEPFKNTTLDFVKTVAAVYFGQKDNRSIAYNKFNYWMQYIRQRYYLQTSILDDSFVKLLSKKSGVGEQEIQQIVDIYDEVKSSRNVTDSMLLELNRRIELFYTSSKI
jgi:hypothetical protein